jgi:hypothetical protein
MCDEKAINDKKTMHLTKIEKFNLRIITKNDKHLLFSNHKLAIDTFDPEKENISELYFASIWMYAIEMMHKID